eukprot:scaffold28216_cov31-Tisochrysis_lutea.AAC.1
MVPSPSTSAAASMASSSASERRSPTARRIARSSSRDTVPEPSLSKTRNAVLISSSAGSPEGPSETAVSPAKGSPPSVRCLARAGCAMATFADRARFLDPKGNQFTPSTHALASAGDVAINSTCEETRNSRKPQPARRASESTALEAHTAAAAGDTPGKAPRSLRGGQRSERRKPRDISTRRKTLSLVSRTTSTDLNSPPRTAVRADAANSDAR